MVYEKMGLGACLLLLLVVHAALAAARGKGDQSRLHVLHLFRSGLSLSAISYLLRITDAPRLDHPTPFVFVTGFLGTTFLWLGWMQYWRLRASRPDTPLLLRDEGSEPIPEALRAASQTAGGPRLTARAHQALLHAECEACRRNEGRVDTDHLLLGLLHDPDSAGVRLLPLLGAGPEKVHLELLGRMASCRKFTKQPRQTPNIALQAKAEPLALTERASQVLALAAQEAHRFDKACVGTEHLLLGLVLMGKGMAAAVLFGEGVTVDGIRSEIIKARIRHEKGQRMEKR